jgi:beta-N-acetylhexosaminidase
MKIKIITIAVIAVLSIGFIGCGKNEKNDKVGIRGDVKEIVISDTGANILVEGKIEEDTAFDKASVSINSDTVIEKDNIKGKLDSSDIKKGDKVEVIFTGAVAESYPVQGVAKSIRILK